MNPRGRLALLVALASACTRSPLIEADAGADEGDTSGETSDSTSAPEPLPPEPSTTSSEPEPITTSTTGTGPEPEPATSDEGLFIADPDGGSVLPECSLWEQDCPRGEKCMPWANDGGGSWNSTRCSPIAEDPAQVGEPCTVEGNGVSGLDDCELHAMCWDVDPGTLEGVCYAMCTGDEANPMCEDAGSTCSLSGSGVLNLCIPTCNPLEPDCPDGRACYPLADEFVCVVDVSNGALPGDGCEFINVCPSGTACVDAELFESCESSGCCSPFCSLADETPPCLPGQTCLPWYLPGDAPPGYELVGVCAVPS